MGKSEVRRISPRVARYLKVHYRGVRQKAWNMAQISDFGWNGARLLCEADLEPGDELWMRLVIPGNLGELPLRAQVVWARKKDQPEPGMEHGLRFIDDEERVRQAINAAITHVIRADIDRSQGRERRRSRRVAKEFPAAYRLAGSKKAVAWHPIQMVNCSVHGARFISADPLEAGAVVDLRLEGPHMKSPLVVRGRVVWNEWQESGKHGVDFISISVGHETRFETFVHWMMVDA